MLVRCDAIPEPTFLWWDARLQPRFGTVEVRIMDAQTRIEDTAAIATLVQCLVRLEAERELPEARTTGPRSWPRTASSRRGTGWRARSSTRCRRAGESHDRLAELLDDCAPLARSLGCADELARVPALAASTGAARQRAMAERTGSLEGVIEALSAEFLGGGAAAPGRAERRRR